MSPLSPTEKSLALQKVFDALFAAKLACWRFYPGRSGHISCLEFPMLSISPKGDIKITEGGVTTTIGTSLTAYQVAASQAKSLLAWMAERSG